MISHSSDKPNAEGGSTAKTNPGKENQAGGYPGESGDIKFRKCETEKKSGKKSETVAFEFRPLQSRSFQWRLNCINATSLTTF